MRSSHGAAFCTLVVALAARAQTPAPLKLDLERMDLDASALGSLLVATGQTLPAGEFRLGLGPHYERKPLVVALDGQDVNTIVRNRLSTQLFAAIGLTSALELGFQVPLISYQRGENLDALGLARPATAGLGTPRVSARLHILDEGKQLIDLAGEVGVGVPIGNKDALGGDGNVSLTPGLSVGRQFGDVRASTQLSVLLRRSQDVGGDRFGSHFGVNGSIAYMGARFRPELIVRAFVPLTQMPKGFEVLAAGRYAITNRLEAFALAGPGFGQLIGVPTFRAMVGLAFGTVSPAVAAVSPCDPGMAHTPEQCPYLDDDGDGIVNKDDRCPLERGLAKYGGCPIPDRDHDGVPDDEDRCPDEPGPKERQGCPFHDRDGDGVEDALDKCPDEPGPAENQGCPIKDRDGDGVPDAVDNCPDEPGPASNQGCPLQQKQLVVITAEQLVIKDKIYFATGKATIQKRSYGLLKQVADVINKHPNIPLLRVEGHTDDRGGAKFNLSLSQDRAYSVRNFLILNGVSPDRLEAKGYGLDRPLDSNKTSSGRAKNRRVEFNIVNPEAKPGTTEKTSSTSTTGQDVVSRESKQ
jgi:outer membrane protein OmpA-like peptidoglycan-associated protein